MDSSTFSRSHKTLESNYNACAGGIHVFMQFMKFLLFYYTGLYTDCKISAEKC